MFAVKTEQHSASPDAAERTLVSSVNVKSEDGNNEEERGQEEERTDNENFPQKLMDVIEQETKAEDGSMIDGKKVMEWLESGTSFIVRDKKAFEKEILPKHFHAKCKFMSFVRKLYRWGFRQIDKSSPAIMIFMHSNFVRGDKKRCLKMRSIVKLQHQQAPPPPAANENNFQGCGPRINSGQQQQFNGMDSNNFRSAMGPHYQAPQYDPRHDNRYPPHNQGYSDHFTNRHSPLNQGQADLFPPNSDQYSQGQGQGGMTSADIFEAGLRLQRIEQRQRQLHMMSMYNQQGDGSYNQQGDGSYNRQGDGLYNQQGDGTFNRRNSPPSAPMSGYQPHAQVPSPRAALSPRSNNNNYSSSRKSNNNGGGMSDVDLAAEIMKRNPGMEPREALELVSKRF